MLTLKQGTGRKYKLQIKELSYGGEATLHIPTNARVTLTFYKNDMVQIVEYATRDILPMEHIVTSTISKGYIVIIRDCS